MKLISQKTLYKLHTYMSLLFLAPFVIVCVSGSILVYKDEIDAILYPKKIKVESKNTSRISIDTLSNLIY